jgi:hypothetical protein
VHVENSEIRGCTRNRRCQVTADNACQQKKLYKNNNHKR